MFLKNESEKSNSNSILLFKCDKCGSEYKKIRKNLMKTKENPLYDKDYCNACWRGILNNRPEYKESMSKAIHKMYDDDPTILDRKRKSMLGKNKGEKNAMKRPEVVEASKRSRRKYLEDENNRKLISERTSAAWASGKFDNVAVGQCKWINYTSSNGKQYKVQGTWELKFIEWLDINKMDFDCHRGSLKYELDGKSHIYLPDFKVYEWNCWVDVKCRYFYNDRKMKAVMEQNPDEHIRILFREDLEKLGIMI